MRKIVFTLFLLITLMFQLNVYGKASTKGVAEAVKLSVPKGYSIENTISKTDEVSINDIVIRYGLSSGEASKPYYGYQCDVKQKDKAPVMTLEVTSFFQEQDAVAALGKFSDGYAKYITGFAGEGQSRIQIQKSDFTIDEITGKILSYTIDSITKQTVAFVKHNYLIVLSYPEQITQDANKLLSSLSQNLESVSVEDANNTGRTYMDVTFSPSCFSEESDTVEITATIYFLENYKGKKPLDQFVLTDTETGKKVQSKPVESGVGVFTVKHTDKSIKNYNYTVTCGDFVKEITVPVLETKVELEHNTVTGAQFSGMTADGFQTMKIRVTLAGMNKGELVIHQPEKGKVVSFGILQRNKIRNPDEIIEFEYVPPKYLEGGMEKETFFGEDLYYITVPISFTFTPDNGIPIELETEIKVYRPPVVLASAWDIPANETDSLYGYLKGKEFTVFRYEELSKLHPMEILNERFTAFMKDLDGRFIGSNIKAGRFDTVSFGLGGLISRSYINSSLYRNDIRKCILIAVPNHGLDVHAIDTSTVFQGTDETLKKQLTYGSDFLSKLNKGEAYAEHINEMVQYINLASYSGKPAFMEGDGVIPLWSSYINGVTNKIYWQLAHSKSLFGNVPALLYSQEVHQEILDSLTDDITTGRLYHRKTFVSKWEGDVSVTGQENHVLTDETKLPYQVPISDRVITGNGKAILQIYVDSVLVSEIYLDQNTIYIPGEYCEGIVYETLEKGKAYIRNVSKRTRNILFFEGEAGTYKISLENSAGLVEADIEQSVSCYSGTAFYALHEMDMTGELKTVNKGQKMTVRNDSASDVDPDAFHKDSFYKRTFKDNFQVWKFYITDTIRELARYVVETGNVSGMFRHNRRLLVPVIIAVLLVALLFGAMANRKIRLGVIAIIIVVVIFFILKR